MTDSGAPIVNIEGDLVALGPLRRESIPQYVRWMNDFGTTRTLAIQPRPMTLEQENAWYERAATDESERNFSIFERSTGRLVGNCGMHEVDMLNRRTAVGIVIGEPAARGRGYGTEAMRLLVDYVFTVAGMHSAMLWVYEFNPAARRCYEKVGFREVGRRRESRWLNGRYWDEIAMDILVSEFESPVLRRLLDSDGARR
ncbi:MAG: GNAT family N-acetyltransferase [Chloroflexia bacterium]|nr:GNAT family N-acetyltransferase [Chloroflexia bacterium]